MINLKQHYSSFNRKKANTKRFLNRNKEKREQNEKSVDDKLVFKPKDFLYKVIDCLVEENIVPTPDTIRAYFEKMIDNEDEVTKNNFAKYYKRKKNQDSLDLYQELYKLLKLMKETFSIATATSKHVKNIKNISTTFDNLNPDILDNVSLNMHLQNYFDRIKIISKKFQQQYEKFTKRHQEASIAYSVLQNKIKFNPMIDGTYKRDYFTREIEDKIVKVNNLNYKATLIGIKSVPYDISNNVTLLKIIADIIIKNIRDDDKVCYFEDDTFIVLLKHSDLQESEGVISKLKIIFENLQIIVNEKSIKFKTRIEAIEIEKDNMKADILFGTLLKKID